MDDGVAGCARDAIAGVVADEVELRRSYWQTVRSVDAASAVVPSWEGARSMNGFDDAVCGRVRMSMCTYKNGVETEVTYNRRGTDTVLDIPRPHGRVKSAAVRVGAAVAPEHGAGDTRGVALEHRCGGFALRPRGFAVSGSNFAALFPVSARGLVRRHFVCRRYRGIPETDEAVPRRGQDVRPGCIRDDGEERSGVKTQ